MATVALYTVEIGGQTRQMKLTAEDAERLGATPVQSSAAVSDKARKPSNKSRTSTRTSSASSRDED